MKSNSNVRPPIILDLGDGSFHYNYNIKEVEVQPADIQQEKTETPQIGYEYETVQIWGTPDYDKCVKAVLRSRRDETEEFNLINKYNAFALGLSKDPADETEYKDYLTEVLAVKAMVKADFESLTKE